MSDYPPLSRFRAMEPPGMPAAATVGRPTSLRRGLSGVESGADMISRRGVLLAGAASLAGFAAENRSDRGKVKLVRVPEGGLQPQAAVDEHGTLHLIYFKGDPRNGNVFYSTGSRVLRVNSQSGSAIAVGTIRGAQMAIGRGGRVHVAWNGSQEASPPGPVNPDSGKPGTPMLYARLNAAGDSFEPQRNLMLHSFGLDGGGSVAADRLGNVYVAWHGIGESEADSGRKGEARRRVWLAKSSDDGAVFRPEAKAWQEATGACGCCGMKIFAGRTGDVTALYRSATEQVHRDIYLLHSTDRGRTFQGRLLHKWDINACPMSSMDIAENGKETVAAWETGGQVYWTRLGAAAQPMAAPGEGKGRKHPRIAVNQSGEVLLVWTEGTGWQKGGGFAWQLYSAAGEPTSEKNAMPGIPTWSFAAVAARPDNGFTVIY